MPQDHNLEEDQGAGIILFVFLMAFVFGIVVMAIEPIASIVIGRILLAFLSCIGAVALIALLIDSTVDTSFIPRPGDKKSRMMSRVYLTYLLEQVGPETWLDNYSESKLKAECPFTNEERRKYILVQEARIFRDELIQNRLLSGTTKQ